MNVADLFTIALLDAGDLGRETALLIVERHLLRQCPRRRPRERATCDDGDAHAIAEAEQAARSAGREVGERFVAAVGEHDVGVTERDLVELRGAAAPRRERHRRVAARVRRPRSTRP